MSEERIDKVVAEGGTVARWHGDKAKKTSANAKRKKRVKKVLSLREVT